MIKAVIFDLDDTLVTSQRHIAPGLEFVYYENNDLFRGINKREFLLANRKSCAELIKGLKSDKIQLHQFGILVWYRTLEELKIFPSCQKVVQLYNTFQNYIQNKVSLNQGAVEILKYLRSKRIKITILSNGSFIERANKLKRVGILQYIDLLVTTDIVGKDKPNNYPFLITLRKLKVIPHEALFVGDSIEEDIEGAKAVGITPVLFRSKEDIRSVEEYKSLLRIMNLNEIKAVLKKIK